MTDFSRPPERVDSPVRRWQPIAETGAALE